MKKKSFLTNIFHRNILALEICFFAHLNWIRTHFEVIFEHWWQNSAISTKKYRPPSPQKLFWSSRCWNYSCKLLLRSAIFGTLVLIFHLPQWSSVTRHKSTLPPDPIDLLDFLSAQSFCCQHFFLFFFPSGTKSSLFSVFKCCMERLDEINSIDTGMNRSRATLMSLIWSSARWNGQLASMPF